MMPRSLSFVLGRVALAVSLLAVIVMAAAWPARHALMPMWPAPVDELLLNSGTGELRREFVAAATPSPDSTLARNRPVSLWRLETEGEGEMTGWLAGARDASGELMETPPEWLDAARVDAPLPESVALIVTRADRSTETVPGAAVRRMYSPNRLRLIERARLWFDRLVARWRWPFTHPTDARTAAPDR